MALFNWPWKNPQAPSNQQQLDYQEDIFNFSNKFLFFIIPPFKEKD